MVNDIDYPAIGERIRSARLKKDLTQDKLAKSIGISTSYISSIESGSVKLALPTLIRLAAELDTTVDTLLYDVTPALIAQYDADAKQILDDCTAEERSFLLDLMRHAKEDLRKDITVTND